MIINSLYYIYNMYAFVVYTYLRVIQTLTNNSHTQTLKLKRSFDEHRQSSHRLNIIPNDTAAKMDTLAQ